MIKKITAFNLHSFILFALAWVTQSVIAASASSSVALPSDEGLPKRIIYVSHALIEEYKSAATANNWDEASRVIHRFEDHVTEADPAYDFLPALYRGDASTVKTILARGVDPNTITLYYDEVPDPHGNYCQNRYLLHEAAASGFIPVAEALLCYKANVNKENLNLHTPLSVAAYENKGDMVTFLLRQGAEPDQVVGFMRKEVVLSRHMETKTNYGDIAKRLITHGASANYSLYVLLTNLFGSYKHTVRLSDFGSVLIDLSGSIFLIHQGANIQNPNIWADAEESAETKLLLDILPVGEFALERAILEAARTDSKAVIESLDKPMVGAVVSSATTRDIYTNHAVNLAKRIISKALTEDPSAAAAFIDRAREIFGSSVDFTTL